MKVFRINNYFLLLSNVFVWLVFSAMTLTASNHTEKIKQLYSKLNTHKQMELELEISYFEDFAKTISPTEKAKLQYFIVDKKTCIKREESIYVQNESHFIFIDYKERKIIVSKNSKKKEEQGATNGIFESLNMDTILQNVITNYSAKKENDSITVHNISYENYSIPESKIWFNSSKNFFTKIEFKFLADLDSRDGKYSKMIIQTKSFNPSPKDNKELFSSDTYFKIDSKGQYTPSLKFKGYKIYKN